MKSRRQAPWRIRGRRRRIRGAWALFALVGVGSLICVSLALGDKVPYGLTAALPAPVSSPPFAADAPFTPTVLSLLHQLEPAQPDPETDARPALGTTVAQLMNADKLLYLASLDGVGGGCTNVGYVAAPSGTNPLIPAQCWTDAQGINVTSGAQVRQVTAPVTKIGLAASWDPGLLNAWGQVEGTEGRWLGVTGIYGPQADLVRIPDWGRNSTVMSEDPFLGGTLVASEVNGIQGKGLMSQVKHFAFYNGQNMALDSKVQDQAAHQMFLQPYEYGTSGSGVLPRPGEASSMMCSYARYELQPAPGISGGVPSSLSPAGGALSCNNPLKNVVAHGQWKWRGFFGTDYILDIAEPIVGIESGSDQDFTVPGPASPEAAPLVAAVEAGAVPLSTFNTAVARILYEDERFHLLGHAGADSNYLSPSHPINTTGAYGLTSAMKSRDGAIVERGAEEAGVLLKNAGHALPLTRTDLRKGVLVVGDTAEYMPADPGSEAAAGFPDRDGISPLEQLKQFAPRGSKVSFSSYMPGSTPSISDGAAVPKSELSTNGTSVGDGIMRTAGPGAPRVDDQIDFTKVSGHGQLAFGQIYTWQGYLHVPAADDYTFRFQFSVPSYRISPGTVSTGQVNGSGYVTPPSCSGSGAPAFSLASSTGTGQQTHAETLSQSPNTLGVSNPPETDPTASGYTERGLANCDYQAGNLSPGMHEVKITWTAPSSFAADTYHLREPGSTLPSFRFAYSRVDADQASALAAAKKAARVIVFADCSCVNEQGGTSMNVNQLDAGPTQLIEQMSAANPNTVVVTNFDVATLMPWLSRVKGVLQMWYPGSEGGTATARLLLGLADPSGHLTTTWPASEDQTIFAYDETKPLYPGDSAGVHSERLNGTGPFINWTEGLYFGYRFFDKEGITPLFPFGWGLSYTRFRYSKLRLTPKGGGQNISFELNNTGSVPGATVAQVYVGPAPTVPTGVQQAARSLAGFDRVVLKPHQTKRVTIHIGPGSDIDGHGDRRAFAYWDTPNQAWETAPGCRTVTVGDADALADLPLSSSTCAAPVTSANGCPMPSGRLRGRSLGPLRLRMTRAAARRTLPRFSTRGRSYMDFFCLATSGIRVGYPSPTLLATLSRQTRRAVAGRVVLALTASRYYTLGGIRHDATLKDARRKLHFGAAFHIGLNYWYLAPDGISTAVLKVRHGIAEEIGNADKALTHGRPAQLRFLKSFNNLNP